MYQVRLLVYIISMYVGIYTWERGRTASDLTAQNSSKVEGKKRQYSQSELERGTDPSVSSRRENTGLLDYRLPLQVPLP